MSEHNQPKIRIGISSCLLGEKVRFDGGHKHDSLITGMLGKYFEWVPVCPEMEIGLGTPRESIRLVEIGEKVHLVAPRSGEDHTEAMRRYAKEKMAALAAMDLHGYILKKDSPSCGMERVRIYASNGMPRRDGRGLFAAELLDAFPLLPVEEEGRLHDIPLRENFVERVFAAHRWKAFRAAKPRAKDLVAFHTRHKMTLLSHSEAHYRRLGPLVARSGKAPFAETLDAYEGLFMETLRVRATPRKHANVLFHLAGFLKEQLDSEDRSEVAAMIENYRKQLVPLVVPITLLNHHFRKHPVPWVLEQTYLNPYPAELMLRNHV